MGPKLTAIGDAIWFRLTGLRFTGTTIACPLCGGSRHAIAGRRDRMLRPLRTVYCQDCGLVFLNPMPTSDELNTFYSHHYRRIYKGSRALAPKRLGRDRQRAAHRLERLAPVLTPTARLLDFGCGTGAFMALAQSAGHAVDGFDPDIASVAFANSKIGSAAKCASYNSFDAKGRPYDLITASHVFEHLRDPLDAFRKCRDWLDDCGYLHIEVPNVHEPDRAPFSRFHVAHSVNFSPETLEMMARKAGFKPAENAGNFETDIVFSKSEIAWDDDRGVYKGNGAKTADFFAQNTHFRYLTSGTVFRRLAHKLLRTMGQQK